MQGKYIVMFRTEQMTLIDPRRGKGNSGLTSDAHTEQYKQ